MSEPTEGQTVKPSPEDRLSRLERILGMQRLTADDIAFAEAEGSSHQSNNCCNHGGSHASVGCGHLEAPIE